MYQFFFVRKVNPVQFQKLFFFQNAAGFVQIQVVQCLDPLLKLNLQAQLFLCTAFPIALCKIFHSAYIRLLRIEIAIYMTLQPAQHLLLQPVQADVMICTQRLVRRIQLAPEIRIFAGSPAVAVALHRAAALHTMDFPRQWMHLSQPRGACARMQHFLYALERSAADDRLMGIRHNDPIALRYRSHLFGFIAYFFCAPLYKVSRIHLIPQDTAYCRAVPQPMVVVRCAVTVRIAHRLLVPRRVRHAVPVQNGRDALCAMPRQIQRVDAPHHGGRLRLHDQLIFIRRVFPVAAKREPSDVLSRPALVVEHSTDIFR